MLSFSTRWNSHRHTDGEQMVSEIRTLGFDTVELGHGLKLSLVPGVKRLLQRGRVTVSSVQNFCPAPVEELGGDPDEVEFTSKKRGDVKRALQLTYQTIDYAKEFNAPFVVVRLGSTPLHGFTEGMMKLAASGHFNSRGFVHNKIRAVEMREKHTDRTMEKVKDALDHIVTYAGRKGIKIGIKARRNYEQAPTERELLELMQEFEGNPYVGYWHDFGHIQCKANLGLIDHEQWLKKMQPHILGAHVHDVHWPGADHCVPLSGTIDYEKLMPLMPPDAPLVWTIDSKQKQADVKRAMAGWEERIGIKEL